METIIKIELPLKKMVRREKCFAVFKSSIGEFGGSRTNTKYSVVLFNRCVLTINRNEYHDRSYEERASEYLKKWSECEKELRGLRLLIMGDSTNAEVKKIIRESLGVDLDEGQVL